MSLNINYNCDSAIEGMYYSAVTEKYKDVINDIFLNKQGFDKLKTTLDELFGDYDTKVYDHNPKEKEEVLSLDGVFYVICSTTAFLNDVYNVTIYTDNEDTSYKIYTSIKDYIFESDDDYISFRSVSMGSMGMDTHYERYEAQDFADLDDRFYEGIDVNEMFKQFTEFDENILCLIGAPGIGKTKLASLYMKYLLTVGAKFEKAGDEIVTYRNNEVANVMYVKDHTVLAHPSFWHSELPSYSPNLVILDDIDNIFGKRTSNVNTHTDSERNTFISNFLSFTDGVRKNRTKFIITTNLDMENIDTAMLRKGRMFDVLELKELSQETALDIWLSNGLKEKKFNKFFENYETIKQCDLASAIKKLKNDNIKLKKYILSDGISQLHKFKQPKKMGV